MVKMEIFTIYTLGITLSVFALYFFGVSVAPYNPDKIKNDYFECGLPASSHIPKKVNFSFFIYAIMFVIVDMTGFFFTLFVYTKNLHAQIIAIAFAMIISIALYATMRELRIEDN